MCDLVGSGAEGFSRCHLPSQTALCRGQGPRPCVSTAQPGSHHRVCTIHLGAHSASPGHPASRAPGNSCTLFRRPRSSSLSPSLSGAHLSVDHKSPQGARPSRPPSSPLASSALTSQPLRRRAGLGTGPKCSGRRASSLPSPAPPPRCGPSALGSSGTEAWGGLPSTAFPARCSCRRMALSWGPFLASAQRCEQGDRPSHWLVSATPPSCWRVQLPSAGGGGGAGRGGCSCPDVLPSVAGGLLPSCSSLPAPASGIASHCSVEFGGKAPWPSTGVVVLPGPTSLSPGHLPGFVTAPPVGSVWGF